MPASQFGSLVTGLWGDAGANFVNDQGGAAAVFGTKPKVAPFVPIDLSAETNKAVTGDLSNYDSITALLDKVDPGFSAEQVTASQNTQSELQGQLPPDVQAQIMRSDAYKATQGGYGGTGMAHALTARDLGLSSLNLTSMGNNSAQQWANIAEAAYSPFTVSTGQQAGTTAANNAGTQAQQQFQFNVNAAPDPGAAGIFGLDKELGQQALSFGFGAAGGAIAGGGAGAASGSAYNVSPGMLNSAQYSYNPNVGYAPSGNSLGGGYASNVAPEAWSDRRLKQDIIFIERHPDGYGVYEFNYLHKEGEASIRYRGVMADEIAEIMPEAVTESHGYLMVDYNMLGAKFEKVG